MHGQLSKTRPERGPIGVLAPFYGAAGVFHVVPDGSANTVVPDFWLVSDAFEQAYGETVPRQNPPWGIADLDAVRVFVEAVRETEDPRWEPYRVEQGGINYEITKIYGFEPLSCFTPADC